jgi:NAD(P)H-dependent FMN reductase
MIKIGIIVGSTRPGRNGEAVARWVLDLAQKRPDRAEAEFELVDIQHFKLPLLDEPMTTRLPASWAMAAPEEPGPSSSSGS